MVIVEERVVMGMAVMVEVVGVVRMVGVVVPPVLLVLRVLLVPQTLVVCFNGSFLQRSSGQPYRMCGRLYSHR